MLSQSEIRVAVHFKCGDLHKGTFAVLTAIRYPLGAPSARDLLSTRYKTLFDGEDAVTE